jgi:hypothetical protein
MSFLSQHAQYSEKVLFQELDGEAILLDLASEQYFGLDELGTRIWQLLQQHSRLADVHAALLAEYDVPSEQLQADLLDFIQQLTDSGLVTVHEQITPET